MKFRIVTAGLSNACLALIVALPAQAHHPVAAKFDLSDEQAFTGIVTRIDWSNPHVHLYMNVSGVGGDVANWAVELQSPIDLEWGGWGPNALQAGEKITVSGPVALNGSRQLWGTSIVREDGMPVFELTDDPRLAQSTNTPPGPVPRWPDGQPRLGPAPGASGFWSNPDLSTLMEEGSSATMDAHGLLQDLADAPTVAPFQDWARELYILRQQNALRNDPMYLYCIPPGGPRMFQVAYGVSFLEQRLRQQITILHGSGNGNWRKIYLDDREQVGQVSGDDDNPLFFSRSVGYWDGDTLVVDSTGFNEGFWFSNGGLPHTSLLHLVERFTRTDLNTLHYAVTIDDPGAYTGEWTSSWNLHWVSGQDLPEYYCQDNRP